jgi:amino acid transporter
VGWTVVYTAFLGVPSEISAAVVLIQFWTDLSPAIWISIFLVITLLVAIIFVGIYGEVEFFFATLKILLIIGIVIMGLVIDLGGVPGQKRLGFHYWKTPGPFVPYIASGNWGKFLGFWAVMNNAVYSFFGVESLTVAAAETENPRQNIPKACKRVFARVTFFYLISIFIVGLLVPSDSSALSNSSGTAAQSPFVIAANSAGIKVVPHIINAVVLTSAWSASNQSMLAGSRTIYALALKGQAPKIFLRVSRYGIPYVAVLLQVLFASLAYMTVSNQALNVFYWFVDLTSCGVIINWACVCYNHIRLCQACKIQGIDRKELPWSHWWTPYTSWFALCTCFVFLLTGGFTTFTRGNWSTSSFVSSYLYATSLLLGPSHFPKNI